MLLMLIITLILSPIVIAFDGIEDIVLMCVIYLIDVLFLIDIFVIFNTAYQG
jgi:hypothetical protein